MYNYYTKQIKKPSDLEVNEVFVFGSNLAGRHGAGAAKFAKECLGARTGIGVGFTGSCFALPTKSATLEVLPIEDIKKYIGFLKNCAESNWKYQFYVTKVGCGLAGYKDHEIAPLFKGSPNNCKFHLDWKHYLEEVADATH